MDARFPPTETLLMFLERERTLIPLSPNAFAATQSSRRQLKEYEDALIVSRSGGAARIEHIEIGGYWGASWGRKVSSLLNGVRSIHVRFRPEQLTVDALKRLAIEFLQHDQGRGDPYVPLEHPLPFVLEKIRTAATFADVFHAMTLPAPDEALDLL